MKITRISDISGISHTMDMPLDVDKYRTWLEEGHKAPRIQDYFPELSDSEREFLLTGITDEEWDEVFGKDE